MLADSNILILSDRAVAPDRVPIPALLATAAVHHHLIRQGLRTQTGLVIETGEAREVHHFALLAGYGAEAINPYLAFETLEQIRADTAPRLDRTRSRRTIIKAVGKGMLKVMSKMGISTYQSYCGAQIFDAVGLSSAFVEQLLHRHRSADRGRRPAMRSPRRAVRRTRTPTATTRSTAHARRRRRLRLPPARRGPRLDARPVAALQHAVRGNCRTSTRPSRGPSTTRTSAC